MLFIFCMLLSPHLHHGAVRITGTRRYGGNTMFGFTRLNVLSQFRPMSNQPPQTDDLNSMSTASPLDAGDNLNTGTGTPSTSNASDVGTPKTEQDVS